jgi:large subunit ribosomal protein L25
MEEHLSLVLEKREVFGKKVRAMRHRGIIPVHLYGPGIESRALQAPVGELTKALTLAGRNRPIQVRVKRERKSQLAFVREIQWDPLRSEILHVDFLQVDVTQRMRAEVPIELVGDAPALKEPRTSVVQNTFTIEVEALPSDIPERVEADLTMLTEVSSVIRAGDIALTTDASLISDADNVVARIEVARIEIPVVEEEEEGEAVEEGEAPAEAGESSEDTGSEEAA